MNRNYTREHYISLIKDIRKYINNPGIYTDIIVGFPGESDEDFEQTLALIKDVRFDGVFSFKYSPRQGTAAFNYEETVTEEQKSNRLQQLIQLQKEITLEQNKKLIGTIQKVLVEGPAKKKKNNQLMGRINSNQIVVFDANNKIIAGSVIELRIDNAEGHTLFGILN